MFAGKAGCFYNCVFSPCVLCLHATLIYWCACINVYLNRQFLRFCCCICRTLGCCYMFKDKEFPPDDSSLGNIGGDTANKESGKAETANNVEWLRAGRITFDGRTRLFGDELDPRDICQGGLGDCWLLAAMACLVERPGAIHCVFKSKERSPRGKYKIRLYDPPKEKWRIITIDDFIPCDRKAYEKNGSIQPLFSKSKSKVLWAMLLEKAFAKLCGNYESLEGGQTIWAIHAMTGDPARWFVKSEDGTCWERQDLKCVDDPKDKRASVLKVRGEKIDHDDMFAILKKYDSLESVICASSSDGTSGLHKGHAYSIMQVAKVKKHRLVQIRNPWGSGEWTGDWSDKSPLWDKNPDVKRAVGYEDVNDGSFWMSWEDYVAHWGRIGIVDRTVDINSLRLNVTDSSACSPTKGCCTGCFRFWCCCEGPSHLYCPHHSSDETVEVPKPDRKSVV